MSQELVFDYDKWIESKNPTPEMVEIIQKLESYYNLVFSEFNHQHSFTNEKAAHPLAVRDSIFFAISKLLTENNKDI